MLMTRYFENQQFREHYDWFDPTKVDAVGPAGNRATSFFVYLVADCNGGTTKFPEVLRYSEKVTYLKVTFY